MSRVDVDGVGIEYEVTGEGRPVVLLHGFPTLAGYGGIRHGHWRTPGSRSSCPTCAATGARTSPNRSTPTRFRSWPVAVRAA